MMGLNPVDRVTNVLITPSGTIKFRKLTLDRASGSRTYIHKKSGDALIPDFPGEPSGIVVNPVPIKMETWGGFITTPPPLELVPRKVSAYGRYFGGETGSLCLSSASIPWTQSRKKGSRPYGKAQSSYYQACVAAIGESGVAEAQRRSGPTLNEGITIMLAVVVGIAVLITTVLMWPTISHMASGFVPHLGKK